MEQSKKESKKLKIKNGRKKMTMIMLLKKKIMKVKNKKRRTTMLLFFTSLLSLLLYAVPLFFFHKGAAPIQDLAGRPTGPTEYAQYRTQVCGHLRDSLKWEVAPTLREAEGLRARQLLYEFCFEGVPPLFGPCIAAHPIVLQAELCLAAGIPPRWVRRRPGKIF